jgi:hypothetical protein
MPDPTYIYHLFPNDTLIRLYRSKRGFDDQYWGGKEWLDSCFNGNWTISKSVIIDAAEAREIMLKETRRLS